VLDKIRKPRSRESVENACSKKTKGRATKVWRVCLSGHFRLPPFLVNLSLTVMLTPSRYSRSKAY
jgi:hypothetical protein